MTERKVAFHIEGSHGSFDVDEEGLPMTELPKDYAHILRLDVEEYRTWSKDVYPASDTNIDILEVGFWWMEEKEKKYEPADMTYRERLSDGQRAVFVTTEAFNLLKGNA